MERRLRDGRRGLLECSIDSLLEGILDARGMWLSLRDAGSILLGGNLGEIAFTSVAAIANKHSLQTSRRLGRAYAEVS